jgi:hypothetical protein
MTNTECHPLISNCHPPPLHSTPPATLLLFFLCFFHSSVPTISIISLAHTCFPLLYKISSCYTNSAAKFYYSHT